MFKWKWSHIATLTFIFAILWLPATAAAQDSDTVARVVAAVNVDRVANGLPPYKLNSLLTLSAQRHSEYQASIGMWTHNSPDGGLSLQRAQAVGYPAIRANENVFAGHVTPEEAVKWWYTADAAHRNNVLHTSMREIGVGAAADGSGTIYYTMDISAQPNVLPMFINNDAYSTADANVTLVLTNEGIFSGGPGQVGSVSQVMISNSADFAGAVQQGWAQNIAWALDTSSGAGQKTVYVRYVDGAGRTADAQDTIMLADGFAAAAPPPPPPAQPTPIPVVPASAPTTPPVQPAKPRPTTVPQKTQPTQAPATIAPTDAAPTAALVAALPPTPTLDFSDSLYMRAQRGEVSTSSVAPLAAPSGLLAQLSLRQYLWLALMMGIASISIGILRLRSYRRAILTAREAQPDGES